MFKALYTSATGMNAQSTNIDNTSNNLANVNTNGFKKGEVAFEDLIYVNARAPGAVTAQGQQFPTGLQIGSDYHEVTQERGILAPCDSHSTRRTTPIGFAPTLRTRSASASGSSGKAASSAVRRS